MIEGITIEQLQAVTGGRHSAYRGVLLAERVAADRPAQLFEEPLRIEATTFWLCTKGRSRVICSLRTYEVEEGSLLMIPPKSIISTESGDAACEGIALMCDSNYLSMCNINIKKMTSAMMCIVQHPCVKLTGAELARLRSALALLKDRIDDRAASEFHDDLIRSLVETITYLCCDLFMAHIAAEQPEPAKSGVSVRLDEYFHRFLHELSQHYLERRNVSFYADRLCISSRYLTTIVRRVSGMLVSEWMNRYIMMEAKYLLKYTGMSIQEIAYKLSFPNQSFFGKYFKQHTGMAPSAFRSQQ